MRAKDIDDEIETLLKSMLSSAKGKAVEVQLDILKVAILWKNAKNREKDLEDPEGSFFGTDSESSGDSIKERKFKDGQ